MRALLVFSLFSLQILTSSYASSPRLIGINYGRLGNNLPSPYQSIESLLSMNVSFVKLYDANPEVLKLLSSTKLYVSIMVTNEEISGIASNQSTANRWVHDNILSYYPGTKIRYIMVGNEVFSGNDTQKWLDLVPAMRRIKKSLTSHNIHNIKIGTPVAMDAFENTFPPSSGRFKDGIPSMVILNLLQFLEETSSYFFLDVYPYFPWSIDPLNMSLGYALLESGSGIVSRGYIDPNSGLVYTNLLDQMMDSVIFAMRKTGFANIMLGLSESGWPHDGDIDQPGANRLNAATYNRNLVKKMMSDPPLGTPARPGVHIPTFIFSLYDENQKPGPGTERNWGILDNSGRPIYEVDLTGRRLANEYLNDLPEPLNNEPYKGNIWCVPASDADQKALESALEFACAQGDGICDQLIPGRDCYRPVSVFSHASYALSSYWARFRDSGATCYFNGLAVQTTVDPGHEKCQVPSVLL